MKGPRQRRDRTLIDTQEVALEFMHQPAPAFTMLYLPVLERAVSATPWQGGAAAPLGQAAPQLEGGLRSPAHKHDCWRAGHWISSPPLPPFRRQPPAIHGP